MECAWRQKFYILPWVTQQNHAIFLARFIPNEPFQVNSGLGRGTRFESAVEVLHKFERDCSGLVREQSSRIEEWFRWFSTCRPPPSQILDILLLHISS